MSARPKPNCQAARTWLAGRLGRGVYAGFTGQDSPAFSVFIHAVELYLYGDDRGRRGAIRAMRGALQGMQKKYWDLAKQVIPAIGDWSHEAEIWNQVYEESVETVADVGEAVAQNDPRTAREVLRKAFPHVLDTLDTIAAAKQKSWTRDEVKKIVAEALHFYEQQRHGRDDRAVGSSDEAEATLATLVEVDGSLDYDEMVARGEVLT